MKCKLDVWNSSTVQQGSSQIQISFDKIWKSLNDDELLSFKRAQPGEVKKKTEDELLHYEPQVENLIPLNFNVIQLEPYSVDHFLMAPPPVVADQRRKP